jgi:hypothetical protein
MVSCPPFHKSGPAAQLIRHGLALADIQCKRVAGVRRCCSRGRPIRHSTALKLPSYPPSPATGRLSESLLLGLGAVTAAQALEDADLTVFLPLTARNCKLIPGQRAAYVAVRHGPISPPTGVDSIARGTTDLCGTHMGYRKASAASR